MVDKSDLVSVVQSALRLHQPFLIRAADNTDAIDGRVGAAVLLKLRVAIMLYLETRNSRHAIVTGQLNYGRWIAGHALNCVESEVTKPLVPLQQIGFMHIVRVCPVIFECYHDRVVRAVSPACRCRIRRQQVAVDRYLQHDHAATSSHKRTLVSVLNESETFDLELYILTDVLRQAEPFTRP